MDPADTPPAAGHDRHVPSGPLGLADVVALGTVLGVWAHPDDEAYLAAGLMGALVDAGQRVVSVTATLGESGVPGRPAAEVAARRRAELASALAAVGVRESHELGLVDGTCATADGDAVVARLVALVDDVRADTVVTFGPEGMTGHPDHRAVSRWVDRAVARAARPPRLLHATETPERITEFADLVARFDVVVAGHAPPRTPRERLAVHLELAGPDLRRKLAALRAHASQTTALERTLGSARYAAWVAEESFVDAAGSAAEA